MDISRCLSPQNIVISTTEHILMRKFVIVMVLCGLASCKLFDSSEKKTQELIEKQLGEIDWNEVDSYPLFEDCDENLTKTAQRECFENELLKHCSKTLNEFEFILEPGIDPIVIVDFLVDKDGRIAIIAIEKDSAIDKQMPEFEGIIRQSLKRMPPLAPALKRAIPVKAKFRIPIALKVKQ